MAPHAPIKTPSKGCDSVDRLQDRLTTIESHLARCTGTGDGAFTRSIDGADSTAAPSQEASPVRHSPDDDYQENPESPLLHTVDSTDLHVFRNEVDMVDRYHGPSSLFVLCNHFRRRALAARNATGPHAGLQDTLQNLCEIAGVAEPFSVYSDQSFIHLLPKQQAVTAIGHFFQHVDCTTDIFVQSNLLANLERVYSQSMKPRDEAWAICFKAIVLLVLGKEISAQACNALFGDFARSLLPSRAALINSRLLTAPRLINVQTLILLSVAAQQFDPHGWAELLFAHACMLARTMGLHHAQFLAHEAMADEASERAMVLRSLYSRDKSLCTTRGCVSWLPSDDCNIVSQLGAAAERQAPFSDRFRLAIVQDDIHRLTSADSRCRPSPSSKLQAAVQRIEQQLDQYARAFGIFDAEASYSPRRALIPLEFLATRILALQHASEPRYAEQVRSDARASCLLLLIAHGDQDRKSVDTFKSLTSRTASASPSIGHSLPIETSTIPFASVLDVFSVPAFFILLEGLLQPTENDGADFDLLRRVSACYTNSTGRMQSNSYHRKVAWIFDQLLTTIDQIRHPQQHQPESIPRPPPASVAEMITSSPSPYIPTLQPQTVDFNVSTALPPEDLSSLGFQPTPPANMSLPWDNWFSAPSSLGPTTPSALANSMDGLGVATPDLLTHLLGPIPSIPDCSAQSKQWPANSPEPSSARKRQRTHEESGATL
ncbi:MAG: hypothetical protein Q9181_005532 [Wetmoreana brouardii]